MTDQRSSLRFRVPRLRPAVPPRSTTAKTTQTPKRSQPIRQPQQQSPPHPPIPPQSTPPPPPPPPSPPPIQPNVTSPVPLPEPPLEPSTVAPTPPQAPPPSPPHSQSESTKNRPHRASPSQTAKPPSPSTSSPPTSPPHDHQSPPSSPPESPLLASEPAKKASSLPSSTKSPPTSPPQHRPSPPPSPPTSPPLDSHPAEKVSSLPSSPTVTPTKKEVSPVITLSGDNRGTSMCIGYGAHKRVKAIHIHRKYKVNPDEITDTSSTDGEESSKENEMENDSYINCNIQGINNSMVFNCSITERNPGVHLGSNCKPRNVNKRKRKSANKVKVSIPPSQNPTVRRRCLRGLFMESSNSETDDPKKPRRHGCRHVCGENSTSKDDR